jgi:hypothetical protein
MRMLTSYLSAPQNPGQFISWQTSARTAEPKIPPDEDLGDQSNPGLLFINQIGPGAIQPQERKRMRSHIMQSHIYKRRERAVEGKGNQHRISLQPVPDVDRLLGAGELDPFNSLPVTMSSSNSRLLHYCKSSTVSQLARAYEAAHQRT